MANQSVPFHQPLLMKKTTTHPPAGGLPMPPSAPAPRAPRASVRWIAVILMCLLCPAGVLAQVSVTPTVTFNATLSLFSYSYAVTNSGTLDLAIVTLPVNPSSALTSLSAPTGFGITFDPGLGLVSFFEDNNSATPQTFAPGSTVGLFAYNSRFAPGPVTFSALNITGSDFTGPTLAAVGGPAQVPDAASSFLLLMGGALPLLIFRRRLARFGH